MAILNKGTDFGPNEQVTSGKLDNLVDAATFVSGDSGTCEAGGGLGISGNGRLQIQDGQIDLVKLSTDSALNSGLYGVLDKVYPVGSIYQSTTQSTTPDALFFGGTGLTTWVAVGEGKVLVGIKASDPDFDIVGSGTNTNGTTGDKTITLTTTQIPPHNHVYQNVSGFQTPNDIVGTDNFVRGLIDVTSGNGNVGENGDGTGNAAPHNNLQPYEVVYMWKRTV